MAKTLVLGARGNVGSHLIGLLKSRGDEVLRATSRTPTEPGQVQVDLVTQRGISQALAGVERAFLLAPPGHVNQDALLRPVIDEARARGLRKVVLMSAMGANADEAAPLRKAERLLEASGLAYNIVRPNWFMQNFNTFWIHGILAQGKIRLPVAKAKGSFIDVRDIAAVAAELLGRTDLDNQEFDLTGPSALDHDEVAAILSRETGRAITFEDITPEEMLQGLVAAGVPHDYAQFLLVILGYFKAGYAARQTDAVERVLGRKAGSFAQYAKDYRSAWIG